MTGKAVASGHGEAALETLKLGTWIILASECILFASLIGAYVGLYGRSVGGPEIHEVLAHALPTTIVATFALLASGFTMAMGVASIRRGQVGGLKTWTVLTIALGALFVVLKLQDWKAMAAAGFTFNANIMSSAFYTLTGTHLLHLVVGLAWLVGVLLNAARGRYGAGNAVAVECAGLYWHFVDMAWMVIFPVVYLFEFAG